MPSYAESISRSVWNQWPDFIFGVLTGCSVDWDVLRGFLSNCEVSFLITYFAVVILCVLYMRVYIFPWDGIIRYVISKGLTVQHHLGELLRGSNDPVF